MATARLVSTPRPAPILGQPGIFIHPTSDRVLLTVLPDKEEYSESGNVVVPIGYRTQRDAVTGQNSYARSFDARILAVGPGRLSEKTWERIPIPLKVGDVVKVPQLNFPMTMADPDSGELIEVYVVDHHAVLGIAHRQHYKGPKRVARKR